MTWEEFIKKALNNQDKKEEEQPLPSPAPTSAPALQNTGWSGLADSIARKAVQSSPTPTPQPQANSLWDSIKTMATSPTQAVAQTPAETPTQPSQPDFLSKLLGLGSTEEKPKEPSYDPEAASAKMHTDFADWQRRRAAEQADDAAKKSAKAQGRLFSAGLDLDTSAAGEFAYQMDTSDQQRRYNEAREQAQKALEEKRQADERKAQTEGEFYRSLQQNPDYARRAKQGEQSGQSKIAKADELRKDVQAGLYDTDAEALNDLTREDVTVYGHLTDEEKQMYHYLLNAYGEDEANHFLDAARETLNAREGEKRAASIEALPGAARLPLELGQAGVAGLMNAVNGLTQNLSSKAQKTSPLAYESQFTQQNIAERNGGKSAEGIAYGAVNTMANMVPSLMVGALNPAAGAATMGLQSKGNAYKQALDEGYTKGQAQIYSTAIGAAEGGLQYLLGAFSNLGGINQFTGKLLDKIGSSALKTVASRAIGTLGEVNEEYLQNKIDPWLRNRIFGENNEIKMWDDNDLDTVILTTITTLLMNGAEDVGQNIQLNKVAPEVGASWIKGGLDGDLVEHALASTDASVRNLAQSMKQGDVAWNKDSVGRLALRFEEAGGDIGFALDKHAKIDEAATAALREAQQAETPNAAAKTDELLRDAAKVGQTQTLPTVEDFTQKPAESVQEQENTLTPDNAENTPEAQSEALNRAEETAQPEAEKDSVLHKGDESGIMSQEGMAYEDMPFTVGEENDNGLSVQETGAGVHSGREGAAGEGVQQRRDDAGGIYQENGQSELRERKQEVWSRENLDGWDVSAEDEQLGKRVGRGYITKEQAYEILYGTAEREVQEKVGKGGQVLLSSELNEDQSNTVKTAKKVFGDRVFFFSGGDKNVAGFYDQKSGNVYISSTRRVSKTGMMATCLHECIHGAAYKTFRTVEDTCRKTAELCDSAFEALNLPENTVDRIHDLYAHAYYEKWFGDRPASEAESHDAFLNDIKFQDFVKSEVITAFASGTTVRFDLDVPVDPLLIQNAMRNILNESGVTSESSYADFPSVVDVEDAQREARKKWETQKADIASEENPNPTVDQYEDQNEYARNEQYRQDRYDDTHGFDNAKGYEQQERWKEQSAERQERKPDVETAKHDLGEKNHEKISEAAKAFSDAKLFADETVEEKIGKTTRQVPVNKVLYEAVNRVRKAISGIVDNTSTFEEIADAYDALNGEHNRRSDVPDSSLYNPDVADAIEQVLDDIKMIEASSESAPTKDQRVAYGRDAARAISLIVNDLQARNRSIETNKAISEEMSSARVKPTKKNGKVKDTFLGKYFTTQLNPRDFFKKLGGNSRKHGKTMYDFAERTNKSTSATINTRAEAENMFRPLAKMKNYVQFATGKTKGNVSIPVKDGSVKLSITEELDLLKSLETRGGIDHAIESGIELPDGNTVSLSQKEAFEIRSKLKDDIMADPIAKEAYETSKKAMKFIRGKVAEVYERIYGVEFAGEDDTYWNLKLDWDTSGRELYSKPNVLENNPHTKKREGPKGPLRVTSFNESMANYISSMSEYVGFAEISRDLHLLTTSISGESTLLDSVKENYGEKAAKYLEKYIKGMDGNIESDNPGMAKLRSALARNSLLLNPGVAIKQTASYFNAAGVLDFDILLKNRLDKANFLRSEKSYENNEIIKKVDELTGFLKDRRQGSGSVVNESASVRRDLAGTIVDKFIPQWFRGWITTQDSRTVSNLALACYDQVARDNADNPDFKKGSKEHYQETASLLERVVLETQPVYEKNARAEYLRSKDEMTRSMAMFRTQPTQNFNNLYTAVGEYKAAKAYGDADEIKSARTKLANVAAGQFMSSAVYAVLQGIGRAALHKFDDYKDEEGDFTFASIAKRLGLDALEVAAGTVWFGDTVSKILIDTFSGGKTDEFWDISSGVPDMFSSFSKSMINFAKDVNSAKENDESIKLRTVQKLVDGFTKLPGIPEGNAYKLANAAALYVMDITKTNPDKFTDVLEYLDLQGRRRHSEAANAVFDALFNSGMKTPDAVRLYNDIDTHLTSTGKTDGVPDQEELFEFYKEHPNQEESVKLIWAARNFSKDWDDFKHERELDNGKYFEVKNAFKDAMKKADEGDFSEVDTLLKRGSDYYKLSDEAKEKLNNSYGRIDDMAEAKAAGIDLETWSDYYAQYKKLYNSKLDNTEKELAFADAVDNDEDLTEDQRSLLRDQFGFYNQTRSNMDKYDELKEVVPQKTAKDFFSAVSDLEPDDGHESVTQQQKVDAILDTDHSDDEKVAGIRIYASGNYCEKMEEALDFGISLDMWNRVYKEYSKIGDEDISQSDKADAFHAQIDRYKALTDSQKDLLKEMLVYYSTDPIEASNYEKLRDHDVDIGTAQYISSEMRGLKKQDEKIDKLMELKISEAELWAAMPVYMSENWYNNAADAYRKGVDLEDYVQGFRAADGITDSSDPNGQLSQAELYALYKEDHSYETFCKVMFSILWPSKSWKP